jgi:hypothetical protein
MAPSVLGSKQIWGGVCPDCSELSKQTQEGKLYRTYEREKGKTHI